MYSDIESYWFSTNVKKITIIQDIFYYFYYFYFIIVKPKSQSLCALVSSAKWLNELEACSDFKLMCHKFRSEQSWLSF